jgi:hypothetical protein
MVDVVSQQVVAVEAPVTSGVEVAAVQVVPIAVVETVVVAVGGQGAPGPRGLDGQQGIQGIPGDPGPPGDGIYTYPASIALSGHRMVTLDSTGGAMYASNDNVTHANRVLGMTTGAADVSATAYIQNFGELVEPTWNWILDTPVYLSTDGHLTQTPPALPAVFTLIVGFPVAATSMFINIQSPIIIL